VPVAPLEQCDRDELVEVDPAHGSALPLRDAPIDPASYAGSAITAP
jgi:hypothetical protein